MTFGASKMAHKAAAQPPQNTALGCFPGKKEGGHDRVFLKPSSATEITEGV